MRCHAPPDLVEWSVPPTFDAGPNCVQGWGLTSLFLGAAFPLHVMHPNRLTYSLEVSPVNPNDLHSALWQFDAIGSHYRIRNAAHPERSLTHEATLEEFGEAQIDLWTVRPTPIEAPTGGVFYQIVPQGDDGQALATSFAPPYRPLLVPGQSNSGHYWGLTAYYDCAETGEL